MAEHPNRLEIGIGGYMGHSYEAKWQPPHLIYMTYDYGYEPDGLERLEPSAADWQKFWQDLDRIGVWHWAERYDNPNVMDGTGWGVSIQRSDRTIESSGSNDYPPKFEAFLAAVRRLLGGRSFS